MLFLKGVTKIRSKLRFNNKLYACSFHHAFVDGSYGHLLILVRDCMDNHMCNRNNSTKLLSSIASIETIAQLANCKGLHEK